MNNYTKKSVTILPLIENNNNNVAFYTNFDGGFEVGDKLYIAVNDINILGYNILDSIVNKTYYTLIEKDGNKLTLDINYDNFTLTELEEDIYFIGRVYINNATISRGIINGCILNNSTIQPLSISNIIWYQSILLNSPSTINNINFLTNIDDDDLLLKTTIDDNNNNVESYYIDNIGLSIVNTTNNDNSLILNNCDIDVGIFNNCRLNTTDNNTINGGEFNNCIIGDGYVINDGDFINSSHFSSNITWNYGKWTNDYDEDSDNNSFKAYTFNDGIWENGNFPNTTIFKTGRFKNGTFEGLTFDSGIFEGGTANNTIFENTVINNGIINNCTINSTTINDGTINNSIITDCTINDGAFISTNIDNYTINNCLINDGTIKIMNLTNNTINGGTISKSIWNSGDFYGGNIEESEWIDGTFYDGDFKYGNWYNGKFYNGIMKKTINVDYITVYNGVFVDVEKINNGIFYNGTLNNTIVKSMDFYNCMINVSELGTSEIDSIINFYNGSFNSGTFGVIDESDEFGEYNWYNGKFYGGTYNGTVWENGTFYTGDINTNIDKKYKTFKPFKAYDKK